MERKLRTLKISLLVFILSISVSSQWYQQNPKFNNDFYSTAYLNENTVWIVGTGGILLKSINNGKTWETVQLGITNDLYKILLIDSTEGWIFGSSSLALKTTDSGNTWVSVNTGFYFNPTSACFVNKNYGWVIDSYFDQIIKTTNGGEAWSATYSNNCSSIYFVDSLYGWCCGNENKIFKTTDGGLSWNFYYTAPYEGIYDCFFLNRDTGFVVGTSNRGLGGVGVIRKTTDGGFSWTVSTYGNQSGHWLNKIYFKKIDNVYIGWALGAHGQVFHSSDNGETWQNISLGLGYPQLKDICSNISLKIVLVGVPGIILTRNNSQPWQNINGITNPLEHIVFADNNFGLVMPKSGWSYLLTKTTNGGENWNVLNNINVSPNSIFCIDSLRIWLTYGQSGFLKRSIDGGISWENINSSTGVRLNSVFFLNNNIGWAAGGYGKVAKTINGGNNWQVINTGLHSYGFQKITFINENYGWAMGNRELAISNDGGENWEFKTFDNSLTDIFLISETDGWITTANSILKTEDGGQNWEGKDHSVNFGSIFFNDTATGWCLINGGNFNQKGVLLSRNEGDSWVYIYRDIIDYLGSIYVNHNNEGWVCGERGTILKTNDATYISNISEVPELLNPLNGALVGSLVNFEWTIILYAQFRLQLSTDNFNSIIYDTLLSIDYTTTLNNLEHNQSYYWRVRGENVLGSGEWSQVFTFTVDTTIIVPNVKDLISMYSFSLSQNYPNPFNPVTKIKYSIPQNVRRETANVSLKIYDVLGREVATLVNEEKPAGEYEVEFNGGNFPSGIYFYQLLVSALQSKDGKAGEYSETRKMVLLR